MATANCPSCKGHIFEAQTCNVANAQPQLLIVCSKCGRVIGVARGGSYDQQITKMSQALKAIALKQGVLVDL